MATGRINAIVVTIALFLCLLFQFTCSETYVVGGEEGWTDAVSMEAWPQGKQFYAGDILEFQYDYQSYNVAVVNQTGYNTCTVNDGAKVYASGDDKIQLAFGANYFICSTYDDLCQGGMKMAINATARPPI